MLKQATLLLAVCLLISGCGDASTPKKKTVDASPNKEKKTTDPKTEPKEKQPETPKKPEAKEESKVTAEIASWDDVQKQVAAHNGKVVVVDIWSTWCEPCKKEFPHLVALQKKYTEQVACISVCLNYAGLPDDDLDEIKKEALEFLTKQNATFQNVICSDPDEKVYTKHNFSSVPVVMVYDQEGKVKQQFDENFKGLEEGEHLTYEKHIVPLVDELLTKKS